ncbi:MAG TPA: HD-GYP domain-containing protein [Candidatus Limnocylindrales bacterium]|nr:HD-GYP domain-containing protein [Candidatus Limnocylindrales bacterium]
MPRYLKLYVAGVVATSVIALVVTTLVFPLNRMPIAKPFAALGEFAAVAGLAFWIAVTLLASAMPIRMPRGTMFAVSTSTIMAATILGGPAAGAWVGLLGTTEVREIRGRVPWYGTLSNHAGIIIPATAAGLVMSSLGIPSGLTGDMTEALSQPTTFAAAIAGGAVFFAFNAGYTALVVSLRTGQSASNIIKGDVRSAATSFLSLAPIGWLMAQIYVIAAWASLLFALPLYMTRLAYRNYTEMREMFTQTITALAEAVDKRDPLTSKHSWRVKEIAGDIGRVLRLGESDLEALEWGGLLHDVGKIGVPDAVLLKQDRLNKEERAMMNSHPVLGSQIIQGVARLAPELPIIRHHHEWYNGSGYPDRLIGDEIPLLARILHVADSFEAMTAARPYRMTPLTPEQAIAELRKFAGIQFDPKIVDAFVQTTWAEDVADPGRTFQPRPIPMIAQHANRPSNAVATPAAPSSSTPKAPSSSQDPAATSTVAGATPAESH